MAMRILAGAIHFLFAGDKLNEYPVSENEAVAETDGDPKLEVRARDHGGAYDWERGES